MILGWRGEGGGGGECKVDFGLESSTVGHRFIDQIKTIEDFQCLNQQRLSAEQHLQIYTSTMTQPPLHAPSLHRSSTYSFTRSLNQSYAPDLVPNQSIKRAYL